VNDTCRSITFIGRLNALDYTKLRGCIIKKFKIHKNHSNIFRIVFDPSSGSIELYLTEIHSGSLMFVVCLVGVWQPNFEPVVCVCVCVRYDGLARRAVHTHTHTTGSKLRCQTPTNHTTNISEPLQISVKYSSILPDDGSHTIRNMLE